MKYLKELNEYLAANFPDISLEHALFYSTPIGIRFEMGIPYRGVQHPNYFTNIIIRASMIFEDIFLENDSILLVVNSYESVEPYFCFNQGKSIFPQCIKNGNLTGNAERYEVNRAFEDNGDLSGISYQCVIICKKNDVYYNQIFKAITNSDFSIDPYTSEGVYFINTDKHIIFHLYDDRGLDIVSNDKKNIMGIYEKYNDWILDYDRERINGIFE